MVSLAAILIASCCAPAAHAAPVRFGDDTVPGTAPEPRQTAAELVLPGPRTIAVVFVNWPSNTSTTPTKDDLEDLLFTDSDSVAAYVAAQSGGTVTLNGDQTDMFGYFTLGSDPVLPCPSNAMPALVSQAITQAEADSSYDEDDYDHTIVVSPNVCTYLGLAQTPGNRVHIDGSTNKLVYAHELGHNFGMHHANVTDCVGCVSLEYADPYDVMGNVGYRNLSGFHREESGLDLGGEQVVSADGDYLISAAGPTRTLTIPRPSATGELSLEIRDGSNVFDTAINSEATNNVSIRWVRPSFVPQQTNLIDTTPGGSAFDAPLNQGQTYIDPTGVQITNLSSGLGVAQVRVAYPKPPPPAPSAAPAVVPLLTGLKAPVLRTSTRSARIPSSGRLRFSYPGARRIELRLGGGKRKIVRRSSYTYRLPVRFRRKRSTTLTVKISGGAIKAEKFSIRKGVVTKR